MRYQHRITGSTLKITKYNTTEDVEEMRHVFDNDELVRMSRKLHDKCCKCYSGAFDRRTISDGWKRAFDRVWSALYNQSGCSYSAYLHFTGR